MMRQRHVRVSMAPASTQGNEVVNAPSRAGDLPAHTDGNAIHPARLRSRCPPVQPAL